MELGGEGDIAGRSEGRQDWFDRRHLQEWIVERKELLTKVDCPGWLRLAVRPVVLGDVVYWAWKYANAGIDV